MNIVHTVDIVEWNPADCGAGEVFPTYTFNKEVDIQ